MAADTQSCSFTGSGSVCESPGNVQVNDSAPVVQSYPFYPFYDYGEGDYRGGYGRGHR